MRHGRAPVKLDARAVRKVRMAGENGSVSELKTAHSFRLVHSACVLAWQVGASGISNFQSPVHRLVARASHHVVGVRNPARIGGAGMILAYCENGTAIDLVRGSRGRVRFCGKFLVRNHVLIAGSGRHVMTTIPENAGFPPQKEVVNTPVL
jgi:hypothetical protein